MKKYLVLILVSISFFYACNDDPVAITPEGFSYTNAIVDVDFYESGQTGVPLITWNGSLGNFGFASAYDGLAINSTTGVISWNGDLPLGETDVTVIATNANGTISTTLTINHIFSASFTGSYNFDPNDTNVSGDNYKLIFNTDGTITAIDFTSNASGTYTIDDDNKILASYSYDGSSSIIYLDADLTYSDAQTPYVDGLWGSVENNPNSGYFKVELDE